MKHLFLYIFMSVATLSAHAQSSTVVPDTLSAPMAQPQLIRFGYFSYEGALKTMPDYGIVQQNLKDLRLKYDNEMKRVEDEFNKKYEDFLDGQRNFAPSILQKRQAELQDLMQKNMVFKQEAQRLLDQAKEDAYRPLREKLAAAVNRVGQSQKLALILNTDGNTVPFINTAFGVDVNGAIADFLK